MYNGTSIYISKTICMKGFEFMIAISKSEKEVITKKFPNAHIVRTMKQKSKRHHYFCEESPRVMALVRDMRDAADGRKVGTVNGNT